MAAITVTKTHLASFGDKAEATASCASLATAGSWATGLGSVDQVFVSGFDTTAQKFSWTASGGVVTFTVTSGPLLNVDLMAVGYF